MREGRRGKEGKATEGKRRMLILDLDVPVTHVAYISKCTDVSQEG